MPEPVLMSPWIPVIAAIGSSFVTGIIGFFLNRTNKQSEERKHQRELIFKTAFDSWKQSTDIAIAKMKSGHSTKTMPLYSHIINLMSFSKAFSDKIISKDTIIKELTKIDELNDIVEKYYLDKHKTKKNNKIEGD